jgi:ribosomal protein L20
VAEESVARYLDERQRRKRRRTRRQSEIASIIAASKERSVPYSNP